MYGFGLGALWGISVVLFARGFFWTTPSEHPSEETFLGLWPLWAYISLLAMFHPLEYVLTALHQPHNLSLDCRSFQIYMY